MSLYRFGLGCAYFYGAIGGAAALSCIALGQENTCLGPAKLGSYNLDSLRQVRTRPTAKRAMLGLQALVSAN